MTRRAHGLVTAELLAGQVDDEMLHAILGARREAERESEFDHALYAADPTTGFIVAAALIRPEKSLSPSTSPACCVGGKRSPSPRVRTATRWTSARG